MVDKFENYYEILGVSPEATIEEIKKAYRDKSWIYSSDRMQGAPDSAKRAAEEEHKRINRAFETLRDGRREYDKKFQEYLKGNTTAPKDNSVTPVKPKPIVDPPGIIFKNIKPGETKKTSFLIINTGGPYSKINISNPDSWLKIADWSSISLSDELPLRVNITAQADDSYKRQEEKIFVALDDVQTYITIALEPSLRILIKDHSWHDVGFENLNSWAQKQFASGKTYFKGSHFEYRLEPKIYWQVKDHNWHDIEFDKLNSWAQQQFNEGKTSFKGTHFEYCVNQKSGRYQICLLHKHSSAIYAPTISGKYQFCLRQKHKSAIYAP